jgi:hypothetical protein
VSGTGSVPTLTLSSPSVGQLNTDTIHRITISLSSGGSNLSAVFDAKFDNRPTTRLLLPAQTVQVSALGITTGIPITSQTMPLLTVTQSTRSAVFNALNLITLLQERSFGGLSAAKLLDGFLPAGEAGNYTLNIDLGSNSQIYTSSNQPIQIISLPIRLN